MKSLVRLLGSRPVVAASSRLTRGRLRVLAYHRITDAGAFARQLDRVSAHYETVTGSAVADWIEGRRALPARPIWLTFDDGDPSVVRDGAPLLKERNLVATMLVCPGVVDTCRPHWWDIVDDARGAGVVREGDLHVLGHPDVLRALKAADDDERRRVVALLDDRLEVAARPAARAQLTTDDLRRWVEAGNEVGSHSWDHPCLDRCAPVEQRRQIERAHDWLTRTLGRPPDVFAWPNGNVAEPALTVLRELEYRLVLAADHRVCVRRPDPMALSRLRIDADVDLTRFDAIVSGAHPSVFALARRLGLRT